MDSPEATHAFAVQVASQLSQSKLCDSERLAERLKAAFDRSYMAYEMLKRACPAENLSHLSLDYIYEKAEFACTIAGM